MENKKLFELMTQMYSDMQKGFENVDERLGRLEEKVEQNSKDILRLEAKVEQNSKDIVRLENKLDDSTKVLFDGITQLTSQYERIDRRVEKLEEGILEKGIVLPSEYYIQILKRVD